MRKITLVLILLGATSVNAQTSDTLFYERFENGGNTFTLNTADLGGVNATTGYNQWVVNDAYTGGSGQLVCAGFPTTFTIPDNQTQPVGVMGGSSTNYMHITSDAAQASGIFNNSFLAANGLCGGNESYFAAMNLDIATTNYSTVNLSFWWMCGGGSNSFGEVYYSTDGGISWTLAGTSATYSGQNTWVQEVLSLPAFAGQNTLRFGFRFVNNITFNASDPAFGIDEVFIDGEVLMAPPVAAFSVSDSSLCEGGCVDFTDLSTGDPTSWLWIFQGASTGFSSLQNPSQICYPNPGTYEVTLIISSVAGTDTLTQSAITIYPNPQPPVLTAMGDTITAPTGFTNYEWYVDSMIVAGADSNEIISMQNGTYYVTVTDSNGCIASSQPIVLSTGLHELWEQKRLVYPNPTTGLIYFHQNIKSDDVTIYNALGEIKWLPKYKAQNNFIDLSALVEGIYYITTTDRNGNLCRDKILKTDK